MGIGSVVISMNSGNIKNQGSYQSSHSKDVDSNGQLSGAQNPVNVAVDKDVDTNIPVNGAQNAASANKVGDGDCQTCKNRKYQDESNDSGVSYQSPTKLGGNVAAAVMSHEQEHVSRNQIKAENEDRKVVSQSVAIHTAICPECGKSYVSGGTTRTVTASDKSAQEEQYNAIPDTGKGGSLDTTA